MSALMDTLHTETFTLTRGVLPLLVSLPHAGTHIPDPLRGDLVDTALAVPDTDWRLGEVYAFALDMGASVLLPVHSRYVVDLNRPPDDAPMYPGANNTGLCPTRAFSGEPLYRAGHEPDAKAIAARRARYWQPYHDALAAELGRLQAVHGGPVLLWDGHSIKSEVPWLFEGRLADLNLGTADGASCAPALRALLQDVLTVQTRYSQVVDGRFKGGYITRHYGRPASGVHAVQMEMVLAAYLREEAAPWALDPAKLAELQGLLKALLSTAVAWAMAQGAHACGLHQGARP